MTNKKRSWFVYMLKCCDGSFYTGVTIDIQRRLEEHNTSKQGARYTRARRPVELIYQEVLDSRSAATKREYQIKQLSRDEKLQLVKQGLVS